jgi:hypothetical protein
MDSSYRTKLHIEIGPNYTFYHRITYFAIRETLERINHRKMIGAMGRIIKLLQYGST